MVVLLTFFCMMSIILLQLEVAANVGNRCEIQGQNYVPKLQGTETPAEFYYRNLILGI